MIKILESKDYPDLKKGDKFTLGPFDDVDCTVIKIDGKYVYYKYDHAYDKNEKPRRCNISNVSLVKRNGKTIWKDTRHEISDYD